jgi:hypothetical protein
LSFRSDLDAEDRGLQIEFDDRRRGGEIAGRRHLLRKLAEAHKIVFGFHRPVAQERPFDTGAGEQPERLKLPFAVPARAPARPLFAL